MVEAAEEPFREFREAVTRAHAHGQHASLVRVDRVAEGCYMLRRRTRRHRDPVGGHVVEGSEDELVPPDWRAAAWGLELRHPDGFARSLQAPGPGGGPDARMAGRPDRAGRTTPPP